MKKCSTCKIEKDVSCFGNYKRSKDGLRYQCNDCRNKHKKIYREANKDKISEYKRNYRKANKDKINEQKRNYRKTRRAEDRPWYLRQRVSTQVWDALKKRGYNKAGSVWEALPYTSKQLCEHLESQFDDKMSWDNYGTYWHIDHIFPQSELPYENYEDPNFQKCWALDNLRPLEASENIAKSNKIL